MHSGYDKFTLDQKIKAKNAFIRLPSPLPRTYLPFQGAIETWIKYQEENRLSDAALLKKLISNINHVSFEFFLSQLKNTVDAFQNAVKTPYILWVANGEHELASGCSDSWVAGLALEYCGLRFPELILTSDQLPKYLVNQTTPLPILILDDSAYTANHLLDQMSRLLLHVIEAKEEMMKINLTDLEIQKIADELNQLPFWIGVPFMTPHAEELLSKGANTRLLPHVLIPRIVDLLSESEAQRLEKLGISLGNRTLTYFDHAFPDGMSTLPLNRFLTPYEKLIPDVERPYRPKMKPSSGNEEEKPTSSRKLGF